MGWDAKRVAGYQQSALRRLLARATKHSPFHARRLGGIDPAHFDLAQLPALPTMSKADMMASFDEIVTDRRINLSDVQTHLQRTGRKPELYAGRYFATTTGGSSGLKGVFLYDWDAMIDFGARIMVSAGPPPADARVVATIASPGAIHILRLGFALIDGEHFRVVDTPVTLPLGEIVGRLNEQQPDVLFGYPAMLFRLAVEQEAGRLSISPVRIRSSAATLTPVAEERIAAAFDAPVIDTYGATEGIVGTRPAGSAVFTFASDLAIIELVDKEHRPVPVGQPSAKVLLTNLFNLAQPLIRYEVEDQFVLAKAVGGSGHLSATVNGRAMSEFDYGNTCVYPGGIVSLLMTYPAVIDYQIRQTPRGVDVDLLSWAACDTAALSRQVKRLLVDAGLTDAQISVRQVDKLDVDSATGKHRRVVPLHPDHVPADVHRAAN